MAESTTPETAGLSPVEPWDFAITQWLRDRTLISTNTSPQLKQVNTYAQRLYDFATKR